jgi:hypothetical protein
VKGIVFNIVEDVVDETLPDQSWDDAVEAAGVRGAYTSLGSYPDQDLVAIVGALSESTGLDVADVLRHAGRHGFAQLAMRHPDLLDGVGSLTELLEHLDDVIHPEVHKLYPDAQTPRFRVDADSGDGLLLHYESSRQLCMLAEGLVAGAADHFGVSVDITQPRCTLRGDDACTIEVRST